mmetsp:Transcript_35505/g.100012  ORF Transcript_35505/g.100012 Transcript_35505/m.100012 type:complete len:493 (-) Transcript_35505:210-1688(-)
MPRSERVTRGSVALLGHHRRGEQEALGQLHQPRQPPQGALAEEEPRDVLQDGERVVLDRVLQRRRHRGLDERQGVLADGFGVAHAAEALDPCEAVKPALLHPPEGQALAHVERREVVDGHHAHVQAVPDALGPAIRAEHGRPEAERAVVHEAHHFVLGAPPHHRHDGPEHFLAPDAHRAVDALEHRGGVELALHPLGQLPAAQHAGPLGHGVVDERLHLPRVVAHHTRPAVHPEAPGPADGVAELEAPGEGRHLGHEGVVGGAVFDEEPLPAGAVLAAGLEGGAHRDGGGLVEVGPAAHDEPVLAPELHHHGGEPLRGGGHHPLPHGHAPHEHHLVHLCRHQRVAGLPVPVDDLHQVLGGPRGPQGGFDGALVVPGAPRGVLRDLDHEGAARHHRRRERAHDVVEGVVPGHDGGHHPHGVVLHVGALVEHHPPHRPALGTQVLLALGQQPADLLAGGHELAKPGVQHGLAAVARGDAADVLGVLQGEPQQRA